MMGDDDPAVGFRDSDGEWVTWVDAALALRRASLAAVRGGDQPIGSAWYTEIRDRFRADRPDLFKQLPTPIRRARDTEELEARWLQEHPFATDTNVYDAFEPFLDRLEGIAAPVAPQLEKAAEAIDAAWLLENWHKALERRDADPKGAITSARSMLEDVFRVVLKTYGIEAPRKAKLNQLYTQIRKIEELRLPPRRIARTRSA